jgi:hypothetical protein
MLRRVFLLAYEVASALNSHLPPGWSKILTNVRFAVMMCSRRAATLQSSNVDSRPPSTWISSAEEAARHDVSSHLGFSSQQREYYAKYTAAAKVKQKRSTTSFGAD